MLNIAFKRETQQKDKTTLIITVNGFEKSQKQPLTVLDNLINFSGYEKGKFILLDLALEQKTNEPIW